MLQMVSGSYGEAEDLALTAHALPTLSRLWDLKFHQKVVNKGPLFLSEQWALPMSTRV